MINTEQLKAALEKRFQESLPEGSQRYIVFWYDHDASFVDSIEELDLSGIKVWALTENNAFHSKRLLEKEDTSSNYLIYAPFPQPVNEENWLLDILLYSAEFSADKVSMLMNELLLVDSSLRSLLGEQISFFDNKDRYQKLLALSQGHWDKGSLELGMMAVACKVKTANLESVIKALFLAGINEEDNLLWGQLLKWPGEEIFWRYVQREYGFYNEAPSLKKLFLSLLISSLAYQLETEIPGGWKLYLNENIANSVVFIDHWMNNREDSHRFDELAKYFEEELKVSKYFADWRLEAYLNCDILEIFDKAIILEIVNSLVAGGQDYDNYAEIIALRRSSHWYDKFANVYGALEAAINLFVFYKEHQHGFVQPNARSLFAAYTEDYYQADQYYRHFYLYYDRVVEQDILKNLRPLVENLYDNGFLQILSQVWGERVQDELLDLWPIPLIDQQSRFYENHVFPVVNKNERDKVFVIISDALRYESAQELNTRLNQSGKGVAEIQAMQGVMPSYTKLGMASFLPGKEYRINNKARVLVDGKETVSKEQRQQILQYRYAQSMVLDLNEFTGLSREEGRELIKPYRIIYLYHDIIDATGDKPASEKRVFKAVDETINELHEKVLTIVNKFNATQIFVTADHGFLYKREPLVESDKIVKDNLECIDQNRRFMLTDDNVVAPGILSIKMDYLLGDGCDLRAIVPRGMQRFKIQGGGANYVHGGASLQEIVIPLIKYRNVRGSRVREKMLQKVDVQLTNTSHKITNNTFTLQFFQTEKLSDKRMPRKLMVAMWDMIDGEKKISDEKTIIADKTSDRADDRTFSVRLTLKGGSYDRNQDYYLRLMDDELGTPYSEIKFKISLGIANDFDDFGW
ncbi:MAG: BREX-1 system phosphatase PglZ type A [Syntrophomonadaceae bacterium]|nr:BREX-1 system phosphatase PglZ type A [Syntrophomonadaceae bacterium]MDD4549956.1 BREX-1 system phosphatase PglZ type A [Syntrophomonadaceae bacterium]